MKKKVLYGFVALCMFLSSMGMLAGCANGDSSVSSTDSAQTDLAGTEMSRAELSAAFKDSAKAAFLQLGFDTASNVAAQTMAYNLPVVGEEVDINGTDAKHLKANAIACVGLINMIGELYENESYPLTDKTVGFTVNYRGINADLTILPKVDKEADKVELEMLLDLAESGSFYYYFDMDYHFETKSLSMFGIHLVISSGSSDMFQSQRMENGKFYLEDDPAQEYIDGLSNVKTSFLTQKESGLVLTESFQEEFDGYLEISQRAFEEANR